MTAPAEAIRTRDLSRRLGGFAVRGVSLTVPAGAVYALLGPNGAGKTTVIRLVTGLLRPDEGEVRILGIDALRQGPRARMRTGYVPERPAVPDWMTTARALRHHAVFFPGWDAAYADSLVRRMGVDPTRRVAQLSKGEAGKLSLVLALAHRPPLLVLDEPTDGLDPVARRDFTELLLEYVADTGATVFVSSHLAHELERFADWVGVMDGGRLVAETELERFRGSIKRLRVVPGVPADGAALPFDLLNRQARGREEVWAVRGWEPAMAGSLTARGVEVREVIDLDLEECYVELLRGGKEAVPC
ncbi:MAG TPA: ABC transporter ATP-binding protein [Longimicrobium sp.]|nr:ABC transporter ATP-binding protein [Longimicrobium sp.]